MERHTKSGVIIIVLVCAGIFSVTLELGADAHGQEDSTAILREIQTMLNNQTSTQNKVF